MRTYLSLHFTDEKTPKVEAWKLQTGTFTIDIKGADGQTISMFLTEKQFEQVLKQFRGLEVNEC